MNNRIRVILVTDGDHMAQAAVEGIAHELGLRCISASAGNPTPITGEHIVSLLHQVPRDPVLVMFDDRGRCDKGKGERAMEYVANHPDIEVLGAVAVASNTIGCEGVDPDISIDHKGHIVGSVDKKGNPKPPEDHTIVGDTVDVLNNVAVPVVIGVGDIGKMDSADDPKRGAPITKRAIEEILVRSGIEL